MTDRTTRSLRKEEPREAVDAAALAAQQRKSTRVTRPKAPVVKKTVIPKEIIPEKPAPKREPVKREIKPKTTPISRVRVKSEQLSPLDDDNDGGQEESGELFCICRQPYDPRRFMIGCDKCYGWFHARCVNVTTTEASRIKQFVCPPCRKAGGETETDDGGKKSLPVVKRERLPELEGKPRVFPINKEGGGFRNKLLQKRQKLAKERAAGKDLPEEGDIVVHTGPDETEPENSDGDSSTGVFLSSDDETEFMRPRSVEGPWEAVSEEDLWGENRQTWSSFTKSYVSGPLSVAPLVSLDLSDIEGRELRNLSAMKDETDIIDYRLEEDDDFGEWSKFDQLANPTDNDNARIVWMEKRRGEIDDELLVLQKSRCLYDGAVAFAIRQTLLKNMKYSVAEILTSPLLQGIGDRIKTKGAVQKPVTAEQTTQTTRTVQSQSINTHIHTRKREDVRTKTVNNTKHSGGICSHAVVAWATFLPLPMQNTWRGAVNSPDLMDFGPFAENMSPCLEFQCAGALWIFLTRLVIVPMTQTLAQPTRDGG